MVPHVLHLCLDVLLVETANTTNRRQDPTPFHGWYMVRYLLQAFVAQGAEGRRSGDVSDNVGDDIGIVSRYEVSTVFHNLLRSEDGLSRSVRKIGKR